MCGGSQAHPLPSCAPVVARLAVHARSHSESMAPNERSRARTMANTPLARRMRDESGSPCPTRPSSMLSDAKSHPHGLHPCSRLGRRTPRSGTLPVHDLHRMGREACRRHYIAYPVSWRRVTHLQRSLRWGNASRFESSRPAILNDNSLRNRVNVRFRRLFRLSHRTCDPSSKWAVRGPAKLRQTAGKPGHA